MNVRTLFVAALFALPACACPGADEKSVKTAGTVFSDPGHYAERQHDGRIYVIGDAKTEEKFDRSPGLQLSRTFIGAGPSGQTVVFEAKDKVPEMTTRLIDAFNARYGTALK